MENNYDLLPDDLVLWQNPNENYKIVECRIKYIHNFDAKIKDDTIVTIFDNQDNAYDVYACELV